MQESEERFRRLADNMRDLVCQIDGGGTIIYLSPSFRTMLGYDPQTLLGRSIFSNIHPEDRALAITVCEVSKARSQSGKCSFVIGAPTAYIFGWRRSAIPCSTLGARSAAR